MVEVTTILAAVFSLKSLGIAAFGILLYGLRKIINNSDNALEWEHLLSSRGHDGIQYADWNKIGQGLGVVLCVWLPIAYVYSSTMDATGLALVMGVALAYLGGVSGYAATLRSKNNKNKENGDAK